MITAALWIYGIGAIGVAFYVWMEDMWDGDFVDEAIGLFMGLIFAAFWPIYAALFVVAAPFVFLRRAVRALLWGQP